MGVGQAVALQPGVSRSGVTMTAGRLVGLGRDGAARFAFLMSLPITAGALVYKAADVVSEEGIPDDFVAPFAWGIVASGITGWLAVWGTLRAHPHPHLHALRRLPRPRRRSSSSACTSCSRAAEPPRPSPVVRSSRAADEGERHGPGAQGDGHPRGVVRGTATVTAASSTATTSASATRVNPGGPPTGWAAAARATTRSTR